AKAPGKRLLELADLDGGGRLLALVRPGDGRRAIASSADNAGRVYGGDSWVRGDELRLRRVIADDDVTFYRHDKEALAGLRSGQDYFRRLYVEVGGGYGRGEEAGGGDGGPGQAGQHEAVSRGTTGRVLCPARSVVYNERLLLVDFVFELWLGLVLVK